MKHLTSSFLLALAISPTIWGQTKSNSRRIPIEFSSFSCIEQTLGNKYRTLKHIGTAPVETVVMEEWMINTLVSSTSFQVTSARYEGDMILIIEGNEINYGANMYYKKLKFRLATTVGENHSVLEEPQVAAFSCSFN